MLLARGRGCNPQAGPYHRRVSRPSRLIGIYRADGGIMGELRYLAGHLLRGEHCSLCDITHAGISRKRAWDAAVASLGIPFTLLHLNEMDAELARFVGVRAACVIAQTPQGYEFVLGDAELAACAGEVDRFFARLDTALASELD